MSLNIALLRIQIPDVIRFFGSDNVCPEEIHVSMLLTRFSMVHVFEK